jgi:Carboxypeptidase regulatory-like domain/Bacterial Ig-like domain (group 3)
MRRFTTRSKLGLSVGVVLIGVAFAAMFGGSTQRTVAFVPQTIGHMSRNAPGLHTNAGVSVTTRGGATTPVRAKPQQLFLTRAHSAVFNLKSLKSVVVRRFRPEHEDGVPEAKMPAKLAKNQMVEKSSRSQSNTPTPSADSSFDGLDFATWGAGHPPDENGDVGPNYYIETVNTSIGIYDKSNGNRVAAFTFNSFMSQGHFGNLCDTANYGDPVVLYDSYENRWFITDFAFTVDGSGNISPQTVYQCFAVSKTGDPVNGGWNYYSILDPGGLGDYPKFGIWPDGIYMSANIFGYAASASYTGYHMWALNKQQMYANAPQVSVVDFSGNANDFTVIPANSKLAAGAPPAGSPEYYVSTWNLLNAVQIYKFQVNWDKVSTSTFTGPFNELAPNCWPNAAVANASTPANAADPLQIRAMLAPQYTNQGGVESVWIAHTVQRGVSANNTCSPAAPTGGNATVRWYQANVTGGTIAANVTQGSSFDPDGANTNFRYQPSLAVDHNGDMAMDYTESNATTNPKVMYNGRLAGDALNTLGTESTLIAGTGAQSGTCGGSTCVRWGDYSGMELDPDGCEFWMTGEYYAVNGLNDLTRVGSFHYPGCTPIGNGTLSGTVTDGANPISGATMTLGSRTTTTDVNGNYSFTVPAGTYLSLTADSPGYTEGSASPLAVPDGSTLTQNFTLSAAATSGCLTDSTQGTFQRGVPTNCDLTGNPGVVQLASPDNTAAQNSTSSVNGTAFTNTSWAGETFTPTVSGNLREVDVELFCASCTANTPDITLSIRATTGTTPVPTGSDLATGTLAGFNDGGAGGLKTIVLNTPLAVTAGTHYAFIFRLQSACSGCTAAFTYATGNPYAGGTQVTSTNSGSTWATSSTRDLHFITYINPGFASSGTFVSSLKDANPGAGSTAHWNTLSFTDTTPANTNIQFQVAGSNSQYGPWNYVGPDGTAGTYFTTSGASLSEFNGYRYIRYEAILTSSDTGATPVLSSVTTCFEDVPNGVAATTLASAAATGTYGGTTTLSATLTSGGNDVPGETVSFMLNGSSVGGATTDANGVAELDDVSLSGIDAGAYPSGVSASFAGDGSYLTSSDSSSLTVSKANQAILITTHAPATAAVDDQFTVAATGGGSGNAIVYGSSGGCTNTGADYTITGTGTCTVTYDQAGNTNYNAAPQLTDSVNSSKANQTIHVSTHAPASAVYGTDFTVAATGGNSGNPVTYGSSGGCTSTGAHFTMTSGSTDCTVTYDQAGNANYNAATEVTETVTAQKADQTIDVTMHAPSSAAYNSSFDVDANAAGGAVSYSSSGACSNVGAEFTMTNGTGTCSVRFDQAGDGNYNAASQVTESVTASKIDQSITFLAPADRTYGDSDFDPGATASSGYAVSYGASGACSIVGGIVHLTGAGSCTVTADQAGDADFNAALQVQRTFSVAKAALSITASNRQKYVDQALTLGTTAFTASGLVGSDSVSGVTLASSGAAAGAASGSYPIVPSNAVGTNLAGNYTITYHNGTLTVSPVGIIGLNSVSVATSGGKIDSFDSSAGAYGPSNHGSAALVMSNGALSFAGVSLLGSTISTHGSVSVAHTASVSGDVTAGTTASISGTVGGTVTQHSLSAALAVPTVAACHPHSAKTGISGGKFTYSPGNGNLVVKSGTVKLASRTYCFNNVTVNAGATLSVSGPVTIHLTGKLTVKGQIANTTGLPAKLHIDTSYAGANGVAIVGGAHAAMTIVAPKTSVAIAGGAFFGTVLAKTVKLTGGIAFHADQH